MTGFDALKASASELSVALAARQISSFELLEFTLKAIAQHEPTVRAFISTADEERLFAQAAQIDDARSRGEKLHPLAGLPIALKDNIALAHHRLTCASRILESYVSPYSADVVTRLQHVGALLIGKTNMDEFGFGSSTENSAFFATRNPHDVKRVPGGTSGGSAAAVASGMVKLALGTDTGGSVRQPASLCGIVGMRPSYGRVSRYGVVSYASSMDQIGPLAGTVDDVALLLAAVSGHDPKDATSIPDQLVPERTVASLRIGVPTEYLSDDCDAVVATAVEDVGAAAGRLGWKVARVSLPLTRAALSAYYIIASVEAASNLARYDGVKFGFRADGGTFAEMLTRTRTQGFGPEAKRRIMLGTFASSAGYADQYYSKAVAVRRQIGEEFAAVFDQVDLLISPVSPTTAWALGERIEDPMKMYLSDIYSVPVSLAGLPALVLPTCLDSDGLPIGVQITGPRLRDALVLAAAKALEAEIGFDARRLWS